MLSKARQTFLALTQPFDSDYWAYWETILKGAEWIQCSKSMGQSRSNKPFICSFSCFPRFKKYLHTPMTKTADVKNHLLQLLKPSGPVTHSKINSQLLHCLEPNTDTDRILAKTNLAKDPTNYGLRREHPYYCLTCKKKFTMIDTNEVTRVTSRLSARTLHMFQITLQHCTTKKYAEIFHLKWRLKIKR